ncbi:hypothetical protein [Citricoccus alkalitolerans]|uniref:EfeO-type cupredoxin-like domain-containing protein n=1 Tax=Citricoccus alkalitolerans TaxID=246603 RepID=A0ABV8XXL0_9MICC
MTPFPARGERRGPVLPQASLSVLAAMLGSALVLGSVLVGCGPDEPVPAPSAAPPWTAPPAADTDQLRLGLTEWSIETGGARLIPGEVLVEVTNTGGASHDVVIHGEQGSWASPELDPGETHVMAITVSAGEELELICTLVGHHAQGMHTTITVAESP